MTKKKSCAAVAAALPVTPVDVPVAVPPTDTLNVSELVALLLNFQKTGQLKSPRKHAPKKRKISYDQEEE
jgi:hypothetical protein